MPTKSKLATKITCPNDGSTNVHWDIKRQKLHCASCRQEFDQLAPVITQGEHNFNGIPIDEKITAKLEVPTNIFDYRCTGCGAAIVLDVNTSMNTRCSWCRNELTMNKVIDTEFTPNGIIPFAISKDTALKNFRKWTRKHWFVRSDFAAKDSDIEIKAIYYPFYAIDRSAHYDITATGERNTSRRSGNYIITRHEQYSIRTPSMAYVDDFELVSLTSIKNQLIINSIEPYDWTKVRAFDYAFLNTFAAQHRDISLETIAGEVDRKLTALIYDDIKKDLNRATRMQNIKILYHTGPVEDSIAYCLAPAWLITYIDKKDKKTYFFALNGQTGKTSGILPVSYQKLILFFLILTLITAALATILNVLVLIVASKGYI